MEFNKDAFCYDQEQQQQMNQGTFLFSSSSSAFPSSTSSLSHHQRNLRDAQIYGASHPSSGGGGGHGSNPYNRFVRNSSSHHQAADQSSMSCYDDIVVPMENDQNEDVDLEEKNQSLTLAHQRVEEIEKEHMFDKVVTPSDVGKLNRLVIPKQHAEKYFPLDSSTNEKGLLLNFEDRSGKPWRFRYSYWNSSQSYVMTKGWSRFVKEKKLDAGDIVSFQRGIGELGKDRLYIDWRRRPNAAPPPPDHSLHNHFPFTRTMPWTTTPLFMRHPTGAPAGGSAVVAPMFRDHQSSHLPHHYHQIPPSPTNSLNFHYNASTNGDSYINFNRLPMTSERPLLYYRSSPQEIGMLQLHHQPHHHNQGHGGVEVQPAMVLGSVPVVHGKAAAKRLRLFGVNMDCPISSEECEILSSTTLPPGGAAVVIPSPHHHHHYNQQQQQTSPSSSPSSLAQFQLQRFYNGTQVPNKGKGSLSLDLDI